MEDESLTDWAPIGILKRRKNIQTKDEGETEKDCNSSKKWGNQKHHGAGPNQAN